MTNVVIDSSAVVEVLAGRSPEPELRKAVLLHNLNAPELIGIEVLSVLRRLLRHGKISQALADRTVDWIVDAPIAKLPHGALTRRVWELRGSIGAYDAAYVALAEKLDVPLLTCDAKLAKSNGHKAQIEVFRTTT